MKRKAVIFDLDGTLLDTLQDLTNAVNAALAEKNLPLRSMEEIRTFVGNGIVKLMERAVPEGRAYPEFDEICDIFRNYYGKHCKDNTAPYDGILAMMEQLKENGIRMAVVSNKADFAVQQLIPGYFGDLVMVAHGENEANGIRKKPAPDMVIQTLEEMGCGEEEAVYVGDSDVDLATAKNSGLCCISVSWGFCDRSFLQEHGASLIIDKPEQLLKVI